MTVIKLHAAGALAALLFAAPASTFAQDASGMMMKDNQAVMTMPNGTMSDKMMMTEEMMKMALENATPVADGTIFFMNDGRMYMMQDAKMENGEMMSKSMGMTN